MKFISLLFIAFFACASLFAQPFKISYSQSFEEPEGDVDLLLLHNGNTAFIVRSEDGIRFRIFDKDHALIADQTTEHNKWTDRKFSAATFKDAYEIGGNVVLFYTQLYRHNMLALHRLIFSSVTGKMITTDEIARIPLRGYGYTIHNKVTSDFYLAQDSISGNYAVLIFEGYTENKADRVKLQVYDTSNKLTKEASMDDDSLEHYVHFAGMCMNDNNVFVCVNDYDPKSKSLSLPLYLSELKDGSNSFITRKIEHVPCNKGADNQLVYNAGADVLQMVTTLITETHQKMGFNKTTIMEYYRSTITTIDPGSLDIIYSTPYITSKPDEYARQKLGERKGFIGIYPDLFISYYNDPVLIAFAGQNANERATTNFFRATGVSYLNNSGEESKGYVLKIPAAVGIASGVFSHPFISTKSGDYIVFNDLPENFDKSERDKPHAITTISDANTIICKLADGRIEKQYLFSVPADKRTSNFSRTASAIYDKGSDTYITLMIHNNKGEKSSFISWVDMSSVSEGFK